ncbi:MAG: enoyl-CoA hydratase/isomerase family protein, partial [Planctomycetaceae bacterium]|nr:enoyl-CoA hydratase/isomerase family protein [Planctomycetaceae bacterium]
MAEPTVLYDVSQGIATITLNRPERLNALNSQLEAELFDAFQSADRDDEVRVIILTGAGRGFCAGADLELLDQVRQIDPATADMDELKHKFVPSHHKKGVHEGYQKTYSYFPAIDKPVIGAINGPAVGLGFVFTLYCDVRIASETARFGTAFAQRGLIAEHGISWMLPRLIGISNSFDMLYTARIFDAEEALRIGLVSRVVPPEQLLDQAREFASVLVNTTSPRSQRIMKRQVYTALNQNLAEAIDTANDEMLKS